MGGIYKKGIKIGTIKTIQATKNIVDRTAIIEPAVDFDKIETVLVITKQIKTIKSKSYKKINIKIQLKSKFYKKINIKIQLKANFIKSIKNKK